VTPGGMPEAERQGYRSRGIDVFTETDILLEGIGALMTAPPDLLPTTGNMDASALPSSQMGSHAGPSTNAPAAMQPLPARPLTEPESLRLLAGFGVATVQTIECGSVAEAVAAAARLGYPVVLKGVADGVAHKSDLGLVHVSLRDPNAVAQAYATVACPRVILQPMIGGALEAIAGVTRANGVGLVLIAGLGGIFTEALHDVASFPLPSSQAFIEAGLAKSSLGRVLASPRWQYPGVSAAFVDLLMSLQAAALSLGDRLQAIDINPVILGSAGAIAVDALVEPRA
jgi:acetate---CoA ligase (ADP-forming)